MIRILRLTVLAFALVTLAGCKDDDSATAPAAPPGVPLVVFDGWTQINAPYNGWVHAYGQVKNIGTATAKVVRCYPCLVGTNRNGYAYLQPKEIEPGAIASFKVVTYGSAKVPRFDWYEKPS